MINIATINYFLGGPKIVNTTIDGPETLLDADLVVINPAEFSNVWERYGKNLSTISYPNSEKIRNIFSSRKAELWTLLDNNKIIVVLIAPIEAIRAEKSPYGTYDWLTNYDFLPSAKEFLIQNLVAGKSSAPNSINLVTASHLFSQYYKAFKDELEYSAYLNVSAKERPEYFLLNRSKMPVGFSIQAGNGLIVFLPPVRNIDQAKIIGTLISCTKSYLTKHEETPPPNWIADYQLNGEKALDNQIASINDDIAKLQEKKKEIDDRKLEITKFKGLLYEQGPALEDIVIQFFKLIGFKAENRKLSDLEHDIVFESEEGNGIAEIEGKDNDSIHINKLDQLGRAVDEDFALTEKYPQGILIGNHYRLQKPENRKAAFTDKVLIVAQKKSFGLITTVEIYNAVAKILDNPLDENYKLSCRTKLLTTSGEIIKLV